MVGPNANCALVVQEVSGLSPGTLDKSVSSSGVSVSPTTGTTGATVNANEIVVAVLAWAGNGAGSGLDGTYTNTAQANSTGTNAMALQQGYKIVAATGTQVYAATIASARWSGTIATFKSTGVPVAVHAPVSATSNGMVTRLTVTITATGGAANTSLIACFGAAVVAGAAAPKVQAITDNLGQVWVNNAGLSGNPAVSTEVWSTATASGVTTVTVSFAVPQPIRQLAQSVTRAAVW